VVLNKLMERLELEEQLRDGQKQTGRR
jgi:hypothetical protein